MRGSNGGVCKGMPALSEKEREGGSVYLRTLLPMQRGYPF